MRRSFNPLLFLIGLGSMTQVHLIGQVGISEVFVFLAAPIVFVQDFAQLKRDGFMPMVWLSIITCLSTCISSIINHTAFALFLRGFACNYAIFAGLVVLHRLVRRDMKGIRWYFLGSAISIIINVYAFRTGNDLYKISQYGADDIGALTRNSIFWIGKIGPWVTLPIRGWYFETPLSYSIVAPILFCAYCIFSSESGRSVALSSIGGAVLICLGRKSMHNFSSIGRHFIPLVVIGLVVVYGFKTFYQVAATNGILGEKAQLKYERQTKGRKDVLSLLMGGRMEFFVGLAAAWRSPLWGYGPWPADKEGIYDEFLAKYGDPDDYAQREKNILAAKRAGVYLGADIPAHSHIVGAWVYYGFAGFLMWLYYLYRMFKLLKYDLSSVPVWFGYFAVMIPSTFWHVLFSPFAGRLERAMLMVCMLLAEGVRRGVVWLPNDCVPPVKYRS